MAIKHVVTLGFGFSGGTGFVPTLGFTPAEVEQATGVVDLTLPARSPALKLEARTFALTLPARTTALTLEDL